MRGARSFSGTLFRNSLVSAKSETTDLLGIAILLRGRDVQSVGYAAFRTFPPDTFRGYRRWLGLSNVGDIR
jgi:hypothetical protein